MVEESVILSTIESIRPLLAKVKTPEREAADQRLFSRFKNKFLAENIDRLTEQDFRDFTSFNLNEHWTGIHRQNGKILADFSRVKNALKHLLDESIPIEKRYHRVREGDLRIEGLGSSILTAILATVYPEKYCVQNTKVKNAFKEFGLYESKRNAAERYSHYLKICTKLKQELNCSFLDLDYCWHLVFERNKSDEIHVFKLSPGEKGSDWDNQRQLGVAAIGWNSCGSLDQYENIEDAVKQCEIAGETKSASYLTEQFNAIYNELDEGDAILYYKNGDIVGVGIISDDEYHFDDKQDHGHQRKVAFLEPFTPVQITDNEELRKFFTNRNTLRRLPEKLFSDVLNRLKLSNPQHNFANLFGKDTDNSRKPSESNQLSHFQGFNAEAFAILDAFKANPTKETYQAKKPEFNREVRDPLRSLFADVAPMIRDVVGNALETRINLLGRIPKNDYGKGGIYHYLWAAFYEPKVGRQESSQLYVILRNGTLDIGFGWGYNANQFKERFLQNIKAYSAIDADYLRVLAEHGIRARLSDRDDNNKSPMESDPAKFIDAVKDGGHPAIGVSLSQKDVVSLGAGLSHRVRDIFDLLMPFIILSSFDHPQQYLDRWQAIHNDGDDEGELGSDENSLSWDQFLVEMNWTGHSQESQLIQKLLDIENNFLNSKKQVVFYGAPGTGKTKAALEIARVIASNDQCIERVQFHQSYSYEHFIEGIRPTTKDGSLSYEIESGPFVRFCRKALKNPSKRFVFIVDEINRGNLSRIFGEMMFLLEYRDKSMPLLYSKTEFEIPFNVYIIGTMNSADRSLALVDYALRRRFSFIEFTPSGKVLRDWYRSSSAAHQSCIEFFELLNQQISQIDRRLAIGHSYLLLENLRDTGLNKSAIKEIWSTSIYPLLEEYFCNLPNRLTQFNFEDMWRQIDGEKKDKDAA